jgi:hypothetical protein
VVERISWAISLCTLRDEVLNLPVVFRQIYFAVTAQPVLDFHKSTYQLSEGVPAVVPAEIAPRWLALHLRGIIG